MTSEPVPKWLGLANEPIKAAHEYGIFGILNLTADSFYDGGLYTNADAALARAKELLKSGTDIIDLGAESSRPGSLPLLPGKEIEHLSPVLHILARLLPPARISVDTWHAATADFALKNGAGIINDVSACIWEPELFDVIIQYKPAYVLMHNSGVPEKMQKSPHYDDIIPEMLHFFEMGLKRFVNAGLPEDHIILDPGIGFGKTRFHNMTILQNLQALTIFGRPLLLGISMKSFFSDYFALPLSDRGFITAVASVLAWQKGVFWHRVHDSLTVSQSLHFAVKMTTAAN